MLVSGQNFAFVDDNVASLVDQRVYVRSTIFGWTVDRTADADLVLDFVKTSHRCAHDPRHAHTHISGTFSKCKSQHVITQIAIMVFNNSPGQCLKW